MTPGHYLVLNCDAETSNGYTSLHADWQQIAHGSVRAALADAGSQDYSRFVPAAVAAAAAAFDSTLHRDRTREKFYRAYGELSTSLQQEIDRSLRIPTAIRQNENLAPSYTRWHYYTTSASMTDFCEQPEIIEHYRQEEHRKSRRYAINKISTSEYRRYTMQQSLGSFITSRTEDLDNLHREGKRNKAKSTSMSD